MRKLILFIAFTVLGAYSYSQQLPADKVPSYIKERLQAQFPQTIEIPVSWSKEKSNYKASITIMDAPAFMIIDTLGHTVRIERTIHETYLPQKAKNHLKSLDPAYKVVSILQITDNKGKVTYKTVAQIITKLTFDENGTVTGTK